MIHGLRKQGRPRKTWSESVKTDVKACDLAETDPQDREKKCSTLPGAANPIEWDTDSTLI